MQTEIKQAITKDMIIGDVLKKYPDVAVIMVENGLHCVGCHANVFDTIEAGSQLHGLDEVTIDNMVSQMNKFIATTEKKDASKVDVTAKVSVSDFAAKKINELLSKEKLEGYGLNVSVIPGGCSGHMYQMNFEKEAAKDQTVIESNGIKVFINLDSLDMLNGAEIDYVETLNDSGFKINNPNSEQSCGCGKSFS